MEDESLGLGDLVEGEDEPISLSEEDVREAHAAQDPMVVEEIEEVMVDDVSESSDDELSKFDQAFDALKPAESAPVEKPKLRLAPKPNADVLLDPEEPPPATSGDEEDVLAGFSPPAPSHPNSSSEGRPGQQAELERKSSATPADAQKPGKQDKEILRLRAELQEKEKQLRELQEHQTELEEQTQQLRDEGAKREAAAKELQRRADALSAAAKKFERELTQAREDLKSGKGRSGDAEQLRAELEEVREQMNALAGEKELLSDQRD
jgi:hypothetical protein